MLATRRVSDWTSTWSELTWPPLFLKFWIQITNNFIQFLSQIYYFFKASRSAFPMGRADAGFWPVIKMPSTTTFGCWNCQIESFETQRLVQLTCQSAALSYSPPRDLILSSRRNGTVCMWKTEQDIQYHDADTHLNAVCRFFFTVGKSCELFTSEDGFAILGRCSNESTKVIIRSRTEEASSLLLTQDHDRQQRWFYRRCRTIRAICLVCYNHT